MVDDVDWYGVVGDCLCLVVVNVGNDDCVIGVVVCIG